MAFIPHSETVTFTHFSEKEGLSNNNLMAMFKSKMGDLWIGTDFGVNRLESDKISLLNKGTSPGSNLFKTYTYEAGYSGIGLNHGKTIFEASDGTVWLGGDERLVAFHPQKQVLDKTEPNIQITGLALFNENIAWQTLAGAQFSPLSKGDIILAASPSGIEQQLVAKDTSFLLGNSVKFKALTDFAPGDFIRLMRLKRAAELLSLGAGSIGEVAFMVGFQDPSYFTKSFQKQFGQTPSAFIIKGSVKTH